MRTLPTIGQIVSLTRQESASQTKKAAVQEPEYISDIARGLHEVAEIVKAASADPPVTYDDVLSFGRRLLQGGQQ
jgi:hypothetical protein